MKSNYELRKEAEIADIKQKQANADHIEIDKCYALARLLEAAVIDEDNTILASEPKFKSVFSPQETERIKKKLFSVIDKF